MNQTHTSYKFSKALKEFLGESAPEPMGHTYWQLVEAPVMRKGHPKFKMKPFLFSKKNGELPAYRLEDLLSKPFCEAMANWYPGKYTLAEGVCAYFVCDTIGKAYFDGGMEAVEKALMEMMGGK